MRFDRSTIFAGRSKILFVCLQKLNPLKINFTLHL